jgi:hypothetical protein
MYFIIQGKTTNILPFVTHRKLIKYFLTDTNLSKCEERSKNMLTLTKTFVTETLCIKNLLNIVLKLVG